MTKLHNLTLYKPIRKILRQQPIKAEKMLWYKIRKKQLRHRFRRQFSIGKYVLDFYCPELKLAIEIDGATHSTDQEIANDKNRTQYLNLVGVNIKRYNNSDIYNNLDDVLENISEFCEKLSQNKLK